MTGEMNDVLVSFLGRSGDPRGYRAARYRFTSGDERTARFFGCAAVEHLQSSDTPLHRWVVLGTAGSAWSTISEGAEQVDSEGTDRLLEALESVEAAGREDRVDDAILAGLEPLVAQSSKVPEVRLRVIPRGRTDEEAMAIARVIATSIQGMDRVHLDITHGFRHLPVIAMVTAFGLQWSADLEIGHLLYAAFEDRDDDDVTPVVDLAACQELAAETAALAAHRTTGRNEPLARLLPDAMAETLGHASFLESVGKVGEARRPAAEVRKQLPTIDAESPVRQAGLAALETSLSWSARPRFVDRLRDQADASMARSDWAAAAMRCYEAILLAATRLRGVQVDPMNWSEEERTATWKWMDAEFDASQRTVFHQVRMLRNAIVHGTRPSGRHTGAITAALDDPERTRALLTQGIALLDHLLQAEPTPS